MCVYVYTWTCIYTYMLYNLRKNNKERTTQNDILKLLTKLSLKRWHVNGHLNWSWYLGQKKKKKIHVEEIEKKNLWNESGRPGKEWRLNRKEQHRAWTMAKCHRILMATEGFQMLFSVFKKWLGCFLSKEWPK